MLRRIRLGLGSLALVGSIASPAQQPEAAAGSRSGITGAPSLPPSEYKPSAAELGDALDCHALLWVRRSGLVQAAQIVKSTGEPGMDGTCLNGALGHIFKPATRDGEPADAWVVLRTKWVMDLPHKVAQAARDRRSAPIPTLVKDQVLHLDPPYYPEEARRAGKEGACGLHVRVSANGDVEEITLTRSAGSPDLDTACRAAIHAAEFVPAQLDGKPTAGATDIWLVWRLPK